MNEQTQLRDYVRILRRHAALIAVVTVCGIVAALSYSLRQEERYAASASLSLEDENRALRILGTPAGPASTPEERATLGTKTIITPEVLEVVHNQLNLVGSAQDLREHVEVVPEADSGLIVIEARAAEAQPAADLANTLARVAVEEQAKTVREELEAAAERLQQQMRALPRRDPSRVIFAERISQIEAVASIARPVDIAELATVPDSPASPKPIRNAVIGGIVGSLLGLFFALIRNSLDRRLRNDDDLREILDLPILAHVPNETLGRLRFSPNGAGAPDLDELEPFRILRSNVELLDSPSKTRIIAVTSPLPEEGKSTVAASLALSFAIAGRQTLLLECDLRRPVLAERFGVGHGPGLADYLVEAAELKDVLTTIRLHDREDDDSSQNSHTALTCIFAGRGPRKPAELLRSKRFEKLLDKVDREFEIIVLDTTPLLVVADTLEILPQLDAVLLCARVSQTTREDAAAARRALENLPPMPAGVVATGIKGVEGDGYADAYRRYTKR